MQGRSGSVGSLPEVLNFDHGSTPSTSISHWNDIHNRVGSGLTECMLPIRTWETGEASSSGSKNEVSHNERRLEHVSSTLEQQQVDSTNENSLFVQYPVSQNLNLNATFVNHGDDAGPSCIEVERSSSARVSEYSLAENSARSGCKRKAIEAVVGQSSSGLSFSELQHGESRSWSAERECYPVTRGISIAGPIEMNPRPTTGPIAISGESSHRNVRTRINPLNQQGSLNPTLLPAGSISRHPGVSSLQQNPGVVQINRPWDMAPGFAVDSVGSLNQGTGARLQGLSRAVQPIGWNASLSSSACLSRDAAAGNETRPRTMARNIAESPFFLPAPQPRNPMRNLANRSSATTNILPGNVTSGPLASSSRVLPPPPPPPLRLPNPIYAHHSSTHAFHSRRVSELVRRSLYSSHPAEPGGVQNIDNPLLRSGTHNSSEGVPVAPGAINMGHHQSHSRAVSWLQRQGNVPGIPHPLRALAATSGGRSRLIVSEIRNVLDLMRRGENLRFEDFMILDPSVFFGMADMHDRHRDMRLDVDNMSYEELLALEERIGDVCTGLSEETVMKGLKQRKHCANAVTTQEAEPCCICQEEYNDGEALGALECGHDFHTDCIKQWLMRKNLCPICKTTGLNTSGTETG